MSQPKESFVGRTHTKADCIAVLGRKGIRVNSNSLKITIPKQLKVGIKILGRLDYMTRVLDYTVIRLQSHENFKSKPKLLC